MTLRCFVLRGEIGVMTPKFCCGMAHCGVCFVLLGDEEIRFCITPIFALERKEITTVEGLPARSAKLRDHRTRLKVGIWPPATKCGCALIAEIARFIAQTSFGASVGAFGPEGTAFLRDFSNSKLRFVSLLLPLRRFMILIKWNENMRS